MSDLWKITLFFCRGDFRLIFFYVFVNGFHLEFFVLDIYNIVNLSDFASSINKIRVHYNIKFIKNNFNINLLRDGIIICFNDGITGMILLGFKGNNAP